MSFLISINEIGHRAKQKIRKHWKLEEMLPKNEGEPVQVLFGMHTPYSWMYRSGFVDLAHYREFGVLRSSKWFEVEVIERSGLRNAFDVRVGIVRKSGKEMVVSNAELNSLTRCTPAIRLIRLSELREMIQSYKELEFFVAIDEKVEEREKNKKNCKYIILFFMHRNRQLVPYICTVRTTFCKPRNLYYIFFI